jgi:hypothetical protein
MPTRGTPSTSPSELKHGKLTTFTDSISPAGAALSGSATLTLYHQEKKTVVKRVKGKNKRGKVTYWRRRATATMAGHSSGAFTGSIKLGYSGKSPTEVSCLVVRNQVSASILAGDTTRSFTSRTTVS